MDQTELLKSTAENELLQFLGVKIEVAAGDHVVLTMPVTPKVHQYLGIMNGGISLFLAETAASIGVVAGQDLTQVSPVGIEINANHLRAVSKGILRVEAKPIYSGRTMAVWGIEITDDRGKLVCISRLTMMIKRGASSGRPT
jgi:1,4-dihydroxy-2-naphthoyl-CoA hydrolase